MTLQTIKTILILSFILNEAFDWYLDYLDTKHMNAAVPENVRDVYNKEEYEKWISYHKDNKRLGILMQAVSFLVSLVMLVFSLHAFVFRMFEGKPVYLQYFCAIVLFSMITTLVSIPFQYYDTFVIEEKYGMNKTTLKTFILDMIKSWVISTVLMFALISLIMFLYERFGDSGIVLICAAFILISLVFSMIAVPLMRIFNKFVPLEDGELKDALLALCDKYGVQVKKIIVRDASRRTTKANAFCTGITKKKTISLDDNLVEDYDKEQIVAVFAHEFAHAKYRHILKSLPFSLAQTVLTIVMMGIIFHILPAFEAFGFTGVNYYFAMTLLNMLTWPLSRGLECVACQISRKHEYEADAFAAREGYGEALISALKKLSKDSLSNLNPHPLIVKLMYSHPTLSQRIEAIESKCLTS
ncbi:MAG: M48 family metallopeptidase [Eubacteriales bacterium]|nr:M48 family metallopeptidase [Eubacteriales bacterium]